MFKTLGIVKGVLLTAKQRRHLTRSLAGKSVLEWVVRQMTDCELIDQVLVLTDHGADGEVVYPRVPSDVPVLAVNHPDTLSCLCAALKSYPAESCVLIGANWPFLDPILVENLIRFANEEAPCDYAAYQFMNEYFYAGRPFGLFPEWYFASTLRQAEQITEDILERQLPGRLFLDNQSSYRVELLPAPSGLDRIDIRLTFDQEEDWENILAIYDALGCEECNWRKLTNLLHHQPLLRKQMARLNATHPPQYTS